jgi:hypothetical protein
MRVCAAAFFGVVGMAAGDLMVNTTRVVSVFGEGDTTPSTYVTVTCPGHPGGVPFTAWANTPWMTVIPTNGHCSGTGGALIGVDYDVSDLPAGGHTGILTIASMEVSNPPLEVELVLDISQRERWLKREPSNIEINMSRGSTNVIHLGVEVWNNASLGGEMRYSIAPRDEPEWLLVSPTNGMSTGERNLHAITLTNLAALPMGSYMGILDVEDLDTGERADVYIDLRVLGVPGSVEHVPASFFLVAEQGVNPSSPILMLSNPGEEEINYQVTASVSWLPEEIKRAHLWGGSSSNISIPINSADLAPGEHNTALMLYVPIGSQTPRLIPFNLTVTPANRVPRYSPLILEDSLLSGTMVTQRMEIWNGGTGTMAYSISSAGIPWLDIMPTSGVSHAGEVKTHDVVFSTGGVAPGTNQAVVTLAATGATPDEIIIDAVMRVRADLRCVPSFISGTSDIAGMTPPATVSVWSAGSPASYAFTLSNMPPWLSASTLSGTIGPTPTNITFEFDAATLEPGAHGAVVHLVTGPARLDIPVTLNVVSRTALFEERILFDSARSGAGQIWTIKPDGSGLVPLLDSTNENWAAELSPDGRRITYMERREGSGLYLVRELISGDEQEHPLHMYVRWMPDSGGFIGRERMNGRHLGMYRLGGESMRLYSEPERSYINTFGINAETNRIYYNTGSDASHVYDMAVRALINSNGTWSPQLFAERDKLNRDRWIIRSNLIEPDTCDRKNGRLSPSGGMLVYFKTGPSRSGRHRIHLFDIERKRETQLTGSEGDHNEADPVFSPGGDCVLFRRYWDYSNDLVIINLATREEEIVLREAERMINLSWGGLFLPFPDEAHLDVAPHVVTNRFAARASGAPTNIIQICNSGSGWMTFSLEHRTDWTWSSVADGVSTGETHAVEVGVHPEMFSMGVFTGEVVVTAGAQNSPVSFFVVAEAMPAPPEVAVNTTNLLCVVPLGGTGTQRVWVWNAGDEPLNYTVTVNRAWMSVNPNFGSSDGEMNAVNVTFEAGAFPLGTQTGHVTVASPESTQTVQAVMDVRTAVGIPPELSVSIGGLTNQITRRRNAPDQSFEVWNSGGELLEYTVTSSVPWLSVSPPATDETPGVSRGERLEHLARYSSADLAPGIHNGALHIESNGGTQIVNVVLTVLPAVLHTVKIESIYGNGRVDLSPNLEKYEDMTTVQVTAIPSNMNSFVSWSGDLGGSATQRSVLVNGPKTINASFKTDTHVWGQVKNSSNKQAIANAQVSIGSSSTLTDASGYYYIRCPAGWGNLSFSQLGFLGRVVRVNAVSGTGTRQDVSLEPHMVTRLHAAQRPGTHLVDITYNLSGPLFETYSVALQASSDNGKNWNVPICERSGAAGLAVRPGDNKRIVWNAGACSAGRYWRDARVSLVIDGKRYASPRFTYDARAFGSWRVRVWADKNGNGRFDPGEHLPEADVYYVQRLAGARTDTQGFLTIPYAAVYGAPLFARKMIHTEPAVKTHHESLDSTKFNIWLDSDLGGRDTDDWDGVWRSYTLTHADMDEIGLGRPVMLQLAHSVFEWNLLVASQSSSTDLALDLRECTLQASEFLYSVTDGQMKFGKVAISNNVATNSALWLNTDVRIYDNNTQWPQAVAGGINEGSDRHVYMPRVWRWTDVSGNTVTSHPTDAQYIRTLVHELGHYVFGLKDEYEDGQSCEGARFRPRRNSNPTLYPRDYGLMDNTRNPPFRLSSYRDYLISYPTNVSARHVSEQLWYMNLRAGTGGFFPCWQWIEHTLEKTYSGFPIEIVVPQYGFFQNGASTVADRQGPERIPLPYPRATVLLPSFAEGASMVKTAQAHTDGDSEYRSILTRLNGAPVEEAHVVLTPAGSKLSRRLGKTFGGGLMPHVIANEGDVLTAYYKGMKAVHRVTAQNANDGPIVMDFTSTRRMASDFGTHDVWPIEPDSMGILVEGLPSYTGDWAISLQSAKSWSALPRVTASPQFEEPVLYELASAGGLVATGLVHLGLDNSGLVEIEIDLQEGGTFYTLDSYALHLVTTGGPDEYNSSDGRALLAFVDGLAMNPAALLMYQMQGPILPATGLAHSNQIGPAVGLHVSPPGAFPADGRRASLRLIYSGEDLTGLDETSITLYWWNGTGWAETPSDQSIERGTVAALVTNMGTYVLMAGSAAEKNPPSAIDDLAARTGERHGYVDLTWTAPGNDGTNGAALAYALCYAEGEILDETDWANADSLRLSIVPAPYGTPEQASVQLPIPGTLYHFALRARDEAGQLGELSNPTAARAAINDVDGSGVCAMWFASINAGRDIPMGLDDDVDGDGLTTRDEFFLRTDPNSWDADGDGMSDGYEARHGLNPLDPDDAELDPDGDGLSNLEESRLGTDPNNADTSGDSMSDGWKAEMGLDPITDANDDGADADPDDDGYTNLQEYIADTHPLDDTSYLRIGNTEADGGFIRVYLDASPARLFHLRGTTNLMGGQWKTVDGPHYGQGMNTLFEFSATNRVEYFKIKPEVP